MFHSIPVLLMFTNKLKFSYFVFGFTFFGAALLLVYYAVYGNFDDNEGWYLLSSQYLASGKKIYIDFYYHRLPFFLYSNWLILKIIGSKLLFIRLYQAIFYLASISLLFYFLIKKRIAILIWVLICFLILGNFHGMHIYATAQSYSVVQFLFLILLALTLKEKNSWISFVGQGFLVAIIQWFRYPIDYVPLLQIAYLIIFYGLFSYSFLFFILGYLLISLVLFQYFDSDFFRFDTFYSIFHNSTEVSNWSQIFRYKFQWLSNGVRFYFPFIVIILFFIPQLFKKAYEILKNKQDQDNKIISYLFLLIFFNFLMYFISLDGHVVQMYFVFLPALLFLAILLNRISFSLSPKVSGTFIGIILIVTWYLAPNDLKKHYDLDSITSLSKKIKQYCLPNQKIYGFTPIVPAEAGMTMADGFGYEAYAYYPNLDTNLAKKYHLLNHELLIQSLDSSEVCLVYLDDRLLSNRGRSGIFKNVRNEILNKLQNKYVLAEKLDVAPYKNLRGEVFLFKPMLQNHVR